LECKSVQNTLIV